tara:strand:- start:418 stop:957 length:540 start_codon:yes stop_codon:yes gene_type:complete
MADRCFNEQNFSGEKMNEPWPTVPDLYGWLYLDRRGTWFIKGEQVKHLGMIRFLKDNYREDKNGEWYIQNGPQKAFVTLEYTPFLLRLALDGTLTTHTDRKIDKLTGIILDDEGNILLGSGIGAGLLDDRDLYLFSEMVNIDISTATHLRWNEEVLPVKRVPRSEIPTHYNFSQCIEKP